MTDPVAVTILCCIATAPAPTQALWCRDRWCQSEGQDQGAAFTHQQSRYVVHWGPHGLHIPGCSRRGSWQDTSGGGVATGTDGVPSNVCGQGVLHRGLTPHVPCAWCCLNPGSLALLNSTLEWARPATSCLQLPTNPYIPWLPHTCSAPTSCISGLPHPC